MKSVTCATLVCFEDSILACHVTGQSFWDLPKGVAEDDEWLSEAAARELKEETGISLDSVCLGFMLYNKYNNKKDIALHIVKLVDKPASLACSSVFVKDDISLPEVDDYAWVSLDEFISMTSKVMATFLTNNYELVKEWLTTYRKHV